MSAPFCLSDACDRTTTCDICLASHEKYVQETIKREVDRAVAVLRAQGWTLTTPAPAQPASAEQQPVAWFSPEQKRAMAIIQSAAKALEEGTFTTPPALHEAMDALSAVYRFGTDTLSGRADGGPDDRGWYRESVLEMTRRARAGLDALRAAIGEGE